jgi:class 3 adenylate cyclase/tetratricopeptide (TPR) repeat protein
MVTALFVDVVDTLRRESAHHEDGASSFDRFFEITASIISKYGGRVESLLGESILALFGKVKTRESDPELAIRAALEVRREAGRKGLTITSGVSTGWVYFSGIELHGQKEYILRGQVANMAQRLVSKSKSGDIMVADATYRRTRRAFEFAPLSITTGGKEEPVAVYRVERLLAEPKKARGIEGLHAELIGRDDELSKLEDALDEVLQGRGQVVSLTGEAGVGKSRLVAELKSHLHAESQKGGAIWLEGRCLEMGMSTSYRPFIDLFQEHFAWRFEDNETIRAVRIRESIEEMVETGELPSARMEEIGPFLGNLLSVQFGGEWDERLTAIDPQQIKHETFLAIRDFFIALSRQAPLILVFEDLHWADSLSIDVISLLMESVMAERLFLLCVYRPDTENRSWNLATIAERKCPGCCARLHLGELTPLESRQLVDSLLHIEELPAAVKDLILAKSQGNPFFLEEVVRSLIDSGMVFQEKDRWRAREELKTVEVPENIQSVILSRVDHLDEELKHVLQNASAMGRLFKRRVMEQLSQNKKHIDESLRALEHHELIYEEKAIPEEEYSFKHVLTQDTIYQSIPKHRRTALHRDVAEAIELLYRDGLDEHYEELAYHYSKSDNLEKATDFLLKAGEKAKRGSANEAALVYLEKGLAVIAFLPEESTTLERELDYRVALFPLLKAQKGYSAPKTAENLIRAQEICERIGDTPHLFTVLYALANKLKPEIQTGRGYAEQLMDLARSKQDPALLLVAHVTLGGMLIFMGEFELGLEHYRQAITIYDSRKHHFLAFLYGPGDLGMSAHTWAARGLWYLGYPDQSLEMCEKGLSIARDLAHPYSLAISLAQTASIHLYQGNMQVFEQQMEQAYTLATQQALPTLRDTTTIRRGWVMVDQGRVEEGITMMLEAFNTFKEREGWRNRADLMARAYGKARRVDKGLQIIEKELTDLPHTGHRMFEAELYRVKGALLLQTTGNEQKSTIESKAEGCFHKAIEVARQQRAKSWELRAATSLARLWQNQGKTIEARTRLAEIYGWFTEGFDTQDMKDAKALLSELKQTDR